VHICGPGGRMGPGPARGSSTTTVQAERKPTAIKTTATTGRKMKRSTDDTGTPFRIKSMVRVLQPSRARENLPVPSLYLNSTAAARQVPRNGRRNTTTDRICGRV
jgi:hypothetical protein